MSFLFNPDLSAVPVPTRFGPSGRTDRLSVMRGRGVKKTELLSAHLVSQCCVPVALNKHSLSPTKPRENQLDIRGKTFENMFPS